MSNSSASPTTIEWLLDSDPAIRWQVLRDLTDATADEVATERARIPSEGWGGLLLAAQAPEGTWGGQAQPTGWNTTNREWNCFQTLLLLRDMGLDPESPEARAAATRTAQHVTWKWWDNRPFFHGEVEPCINGRVLIMAAYFDHDSGDLLPRLLSEQMADGGWNCEQENGSKRGSFHTTINVLEGLLEHERRHGPTPEVTEARARGHEYVLERRMMRRLSTGEPIDADFSEFSFPRSYHYDLLRGLDYLRAAGVLFDDRTAEAVDVVRAKERPDGRWNLDAQRDDQPAFDMGERATQPSRWITLHALRVMNWSQNRSR